MTPPEEMASTSPARRLGIIGIVVLALAVIGIPVAMLLSTGEPGGNSVEAGFLRDMIVHHEQAVEMSLLIRDRTDDQQLRFLATDILLSQQHQVGMMRGWLQLWEISPNADVAPMAWMGHEVDGLMPGMATPEQIDQLRKLPVNEAEPLFIELMIVHHESAVDMAQAYLERGDHDDVSAFARNVIAVQDREIDSLNALLGQLGEGLDKAETTGTPGATPEHDGH